MRVRFLIEEPTGKQLFAAELAFPPQPGTTVKVRDAFYVVEDVIHVAVAQQIIHAEVIIRETKRYVVAAAKPSTVVEEVIPDDAPPADGAGDHMPPPVEAPVEQEEPATATA